MAGKRSRPAAETFNRALAIAEKAGLAIQSAIAKAGLTAASGDFAAALRELDPVRDGNVSVPRALGLALAGTIGIRQGDARAALSASSEAFDTPGLDAVDKSACLRLRGVAKTELDPPEVDGAISDFMAVLEMSDAPAEQRADALISRGVAKTKLDPPDLNGAISDWTAVLEMSGALAEQRAIALRNCGLGKTKLDPPDLNGAISDYDGVLEMPDAPAEQRALAHWDLGLLRDDAESFQHAASLFREIGQTRNASLMESLARTANMRSSERRAEDAAQLAQSGPTSSTLETAILQKIEGAEGTQYERYADRDVDDYLERDHFATLRGWSSTSPILGDDEDCLGGGYFFRWCGRGIVLDPGHHFLRNFHEAGYQARLIHAVVVSHNHGDHNQDLKPLDDLMYEMRRATGKDPGETYSYTLAWDADTRDTKPFESTVESRKEIALDLDREEQGSDPTVRLRVPHEVDAKVRPWKVDHGSDVPRATGLRVTLLDDEDKPACVVGYTADTAFFPELGEEKRLGGCDLLIAHISQPDKREFIDSDFPKPSHLGYNGVVKLLQLPGINPKLTILGEFWPGIVDLRLDLAKALRERTGNPRILPSSIGMRLDLPTLRVHCTKCDKPTPCEQITVAPAASSLGPLSYICNACRL
ncbi:MAG: MBL fold metallo-hydrolase [Planctomycetota bacterium]